MKVQVWDPFTVLARMDKEFDELVGRTWPQVTRSAGAGFVPAIEVVREGNDVLIRLELPGMDVERDVSIEVQRGRLVVSGERRDERSSEDDRVLVREMRYGSFRREFALPEHVTAEHVEASYDAGLLDVRVREISAPEPQAARVPITARSGQQAVGAGQVVDQEPGTAA